jgi:hypothetical protein
MFLRWPCSPQELPLLVFQNGFFSTSAAHLQKAGLPSQQRQTTPTRLRTSQPTSTLNERGPVKGVKISPIHADPPPFIDQSTTAEVLETGIKVVDLLAPYARGGKMCATSLTMLYVMKKFFFLFFLLTTFLITPLVNYDSPCTEWNPPPHHRVRRQQQGLTRVWCVSSFGKFFFLVSFITFPWYTHLYTVTFLSLYPLLAYVYYIKYDQWLLLSSLQK